MLAREAVDEDWDVVLEACTGEEPPSLVFDFVSDFCWRGVFELGLEGVPAVHEFESSLGGDPERLDHRLLVVPRRLPPKTSRRLHPERSARPGPGWIPAREPVCRPDGDREDTGCCHERGGDVDLEGEQGACKSADEHGRDRE